MRSSSSRYEGEEEKRGGGGLMGFYNLAYERAIYYC